MDDYTDPMQEDGATIRTEVANAMTSWHTRLATAITNEKLATLELEVFFVPLPSVQKFRDQLLERLGLAT